MKRISCICVIDDDEVYAFIVKRIIAKADLADRTLFFGDGKAALDYFFTHQQETYELPDVIMLDINMPELNGWQFMTEFVKIKHLIAKRITIYIVSSSIDEEDYQRAKRMEEVTDFIVKPVTVERLREIMTTYNS